MASAYPLTVIVRDSSSGHRKMIPTRHESEKSLICKIQQISVCKVTTFVGFIKQICATFKLRIEMDEMFAFYDNFFGGKTVTINTNEMYMLTAYTIADINAGHYMRRSEILKHINGLLFRLDDKGIHYRCITCAVMEYFNKR
jgi:hypothetical protein